MSVICILNEFLSHLKACFKGYIWWELPGGPVVKTQQLSLPWPRVRSLVWELRSPMLHGMAKKRKKKKVPCSVVFPFLHSRHAFSLLQGG